MEGVDLSVLAKMPLAEAVLTIWRLVADEERLQSVFERYRGRCYEQSIRFCTIIRLIADALLQYDGSGNQSFSRAREAGTLTASSRAAYGKLSRMPVSLSLGLFAEMSDSLRELLPSDAIYHSPRSLRQFAIVTVDGKTIKHVMRRLKPLRGAKGGVMGGKALVALDHATSLVLAVVADPDGNANDVRLIPSLFPEVRRRRPGRLLWLADRQFCDLVQMDRFANPGDAFVLRYNAKLGFQRDPQVPRQMHTDERGRRVLEEWGWLGRVGHPQRRYVRRVTLKRRGEEDVSLVTNLLDASLHPATDLLQLYHERWGIERAFQQITEVFGLQRLIGGTPEATIFQFAFCLLLYNQIQLLRTYIAEHQEREAETISTEQLFVDVRRQLIAWSIVVPPEQTATWIPSRTRAQTRRRLQQLMRNQWSDRWIKATNSKPRRHQHRPVIRTHTTVYRVLQAAAEARS